MVWSVCTAEYVGNKADNVWPHMFVIWMKEGWVLHACFVFISGKYRCVHCDLLCLQLQSSGKHPNASQTWTCFKQWKEKAYARNKWTLAVPTSGNRKPEPTLARMSLIGRTNPVGTPFLSASWESDKWVFAMQIGRLPKPWGEKRGQRKRNRSFRRGLIMSDYNDLTAAINKQARQDRLIVNVKACV